MRKVVMLFENDEAFKLGWACLWKEILGRSAFSVCGLSVVLSMAYILDPDTHAAMSSKGSHSILMSIYSSIVLRPAATWKVTGLAFQLASFVL